MTTKPEDLIGEWVHSHEEDARGEQVFRRPGFAFPPSRGRRRFTFLAGGRLADGGPGADDRAVARDGGAWRLDGDQLVTQASGGAEQTARVVAVAPDKLVLQR
ncbi:MAG TPA: hypothetical protein VGM56_08335 [Byssovorax sp.]|jgi:hypothetical protein